MSGLVSCPAPPELTASELPEPGRGKERPVTRIVAAHRIAALQPGVVQDPLHLRQLKPVGCLPEQPSRDALPAVLPGDAQIADVGPATVPGQAFSLPRREFPPRCSRSPHRRGPRT